MVGKARVRRGWVGLLGRTTYLTLLRGTCNFAHMNTTVLLDATLPFGLRVTVTDGGGSITPGLSELVEGDPELRAAYEAVESFVLAAACTGVAILAPSFIEALETTVEAIDNNLS